MTVHFPVWYSHCTRARFTVLASCSDELTVRSCPLICLPRQCKLRNLRADCCTLGLYCITITWQ